MNFTNEELSTLSNGVLALIRDAGEARKLIHTTEAHTAIENEIESLVSLNSKICGMIDIKEEICISRVQEIIKILRESGEWLPNLCQELCEIAGMSREWKAADGESFESVVYAATEKLNVGIL